MIIDKSPRVNVLGHLQRMSQTLLAAHIRHVLRIRNGRGLYQIPGPQTLELEP